MKPYIKPTSRTMKVELSHYIAVSIYDNVADDSPILSIEEDEWQEWNEKSSEHLWY